MLLVSSSISMSRWGGYIPSMDDFYAPERMWINASYNLCPMCGGVGLYRGQRNDVLVKCCG